MSHTLDRRYSKVDQDGEAGSYAASRRPGCLTITVSVYEGALTLVKQGDRSADEHLLHLQRRQKRESLQI